MNFKHTVFPFRMYLDEDLLGAHHLDDFADVRARLLQQAQLLAEQPYARVVVIALGFETAEDGLTLEDLELHRLDLVVVIVVERHGEGVAGVEGVEGRIRGAAVAMCSLQQPSRRVVVTLTFLSCDQCACGGGIDVELCRLLGFDEAGCG